jgi:hypothetical protein
MEAIDGHRPRVGRMGQLVRIERQSDFRHPLLASTRRTVTAMYGAAVCRKRLRSICRLAVLHQSIRSHSLVPSLFVLEFFACRGLRDSVRMRHVPPARGQHLPKNCPKYQTQLQCVALLRDMIN